MPSRPAPLWIKLFFWLILATISVVLAEVVSFNTPKPFMPPAVGWVVWVMYPLYGLHTVILCYVLFRHKRITISSLYLAGALFGMYEAYWMKQFWDPTWSQDWVLTIGGVRVMHLMTLTVYWHPVMAFILPVFIGENFFTTSGETVEALPRAIQRFMRSRGGLLAVILVLVMYFGARIGMGTRDIPLALQSELSGIAALLIALLVWKVITRKQQYTFRDLLPTPKQNFVLVCILAFYYVWHTALIRTHAIPTTLLPHLTIWAIYAILIGLLWLHIRRAPVLGEIGAPVPHLHLAVWVVVALTLMGTTILYVLTKITNSGFDYYGWKSLWYGEWIVGGLLMAWAVISLALPREKQTGVIDVQSPPPLAVTEN